MRFRFNGLEPVTAGGSPDAPFANAQVYVYDIDPVYNVDDVNKKTIEWLITEGYRTVVFRVPSVNETAKHVWNTLYIKSVRPGFISDKKCVVDVEWGLLNAAPLLAIPPVGIGGAERRPSEKQPNEVLGPEFSFDTTGGTRHITQSFGTRHQKKADGTEAPSLNNAIGVSPDGIAGCDIVTGDLKFSLSVQGLNVTQEYIDTLTELTGTINYSAWGGRKSEELLFLGAQLNYKSGSGWNGTFNFHQAKNRTNVQIGGFTIPVLNGHDYVWFAYRKDTRTDAAGLQYVMSVPFAVYVERVYELKDFSRLGI